MPIRIPTIEQPSAQSRGFQAVGPQYEQADTSVARAISQTGQQVGQAVAQVGSQIERAQQEADTLAEAKGLTDLQATANAQAHGQTASDGTRAPGYLDMQGEEAVAAAADTLEVVEKRRDSIAQGMNERQRERFLARSDSYLQSFHNTVEQHSAREFRVAKEATSNGFAMETIKTAEINPYDLALPLHVAQAERTIRELAVTPEAGDAKVSAFRAKTALAQINGLLADNRFDIAGAEKLLEDKHDDLGVLRDEATKKIEVAKDKAERIQSKADAQSKVVDIVARNSDENGFITPEKSQAAMADLMKNHAADPNFDVQWRMLNTRLSISAKAQEQQIKGWRLAARQQFEAGGHKSVDAISEDVAQKMEKYDGEFFSRFRKEADIETRRRRGGISKGEQSKADALALSQYHELGQQGMAEQDPDDFAMGRGLSPLGASRLRVEHKKVGERIERGEARYLDSAVDDAMGDAKGLFTKQGKTPPKYGEAEKRAYVSSVTEAISSFVDKEHRKPTDEERQKLTKPIVDRVLENAPTKGTGLAIPFTDTVIGQKKHSAILDDQAARDAAKASPKAAPAKTAPPKAGLKPGRYKAANGRFVIVGADGSKRFE